MQRIEDKQDGTLKMQVNARETRFSPATPSFQRSVIHQLNVNRKISRYWQEKITLGLMYSEFDLKGVNLNQIEIQCAAEVIPAQTVRVQTLFQELIDSGVTEEEIARPNFLKRLFTW